jgi:hypothetical protein
MATTRKDIVRLQRSLNTFTNRWLFRVAPLKVDGELGHATKSRVRRVKWYLGYTGKPQKRAIVTSRFVRRLRHPRSPLYSSPVMLARAIYRRREQRRHAKAALKKAQEASSGLAVFEGRTVAAWFLPYLHFARERGWTGTVVSGYRDPAYSERLCIAMCGAPSCPGRCAGRASNHSGKVRPAGAIDVSDYVRFGNLMSVCPLEPRIRNALGARDPVHFSASGR